MHDVVHAGGVLHVAAVDSEGLLDLLAPGLTLDLDGVNVGVCEVHQTRDYRAEVCGGGKKGGYVVTRWE